MNLIVLIASLVFWARAAEAEGKSKILWMAMSFGAWIFTANFFSSSLLALSLSQVVLFLTITIFRVLAESRHKRN